MKNNTNTQDVSRVA